MKPLATCPMFHLPPFSCQHWMKSTLHSVLQWNSRTTANGSLGMMIIRYSPRKDTEVYVKKTDTGLLLHYQSHVDEKYKHSLMKTRWKRTFKLSSSWMFFHQECELLKGFSRLHYPETLVENTIRRFNELKVTEDVRAKQQVSDEHDALIRIVLLVKAQKSANVVRHQLGDLSRKIDVYVQLFTQVRRSKDNLSQKNNKLQLLINKTLFIIISVVCVLQTMSASRADRYIDVWRNTSDQQSAIT